MTDGRTPRSGTKHDGGKLRWDLIPDPPLEALAYVYTHGADKYQDWNWKRGMKWSRIISALYRHLVAWKRGSRYDQEGSQEHLASVLWCAMTLMEYQRLNIGEDDRPCTADLTPEYIAGLI